jgi:hypothetical protein
MTGVLSWAEAKDFSLLHSVNQIGASGTHPASYQMMLGAISQTTNPSYSPPFSAEIENGGARPPLSHTPSNFGYT